MSDPYPLPEGSVGTVVGFNNGDLEVVWDCGSSLKLLPSVDQFQVISGSSLDSTTLDIEMKG